MPKRVDPDRLSQRILMRVLKKLSAQKWVVHPTLKSRRVEWLKSGWDGDLKVSLKLLLRNDQMRRLNAKFRKKNSTTDVLSFPSPDVFFEQGHLGELVICIPRTRAQAREFGHSIEVELELLVAHGVLHLLGWDHEKSAAEARKMRDLEALLLSPNSQGLIARSDSR